MISEKIEKIAENVLSKWSSKHEIPIDVETLTMKLQIKISRAPSKDFSGLLIRKNGKALIGVNSSEAPVRQRFTIGHELGHFFLHTEKDTFVDYRSEKSVKTTREREADMFAAALLMPRKKIVSDFTKLSKELSTEEIIKILANRYETSREAMGFRLKNLSLSIF